MDLRTLAAQRLSEGFSFAAIGTRANASVVDPRPLGLNGAYIAAEDATELVASYLALNRRAFPRLPLPAWVLADVYLLPTVVCAILGPASLLPDAVRAETPVTDPAILAAWVGIPTLRPGIFAGVSLLSNVVGLGAWAKALGATALGARAVTGVTQWGSPSLRAHTRLGPMRIVGRVPGGHDLAAETFVYETDLSDRALVAAAMERQHPMIANVRVSVDDGPALARLITRAEAGEQLWIAPPGVQGREIYLRGA